MAKNNGSTENTETKTETKPVVHLYEPTQEMRESVEQLNKAMRRVEIPGRLDVYVGWDTDWDSQASKSYYDKGNVRITLYLRDEVKEALGSMEIILAPGSRVSWRPNHVYADVPTPVLPSPEEGPKDEEVAD